MMKVEVEKMNQYVTGAVIKELREKKHLTQAELAERLCVSDKTISKWETAKGYPDISLLEAIAKNLEVSITELISGNTVDNVNVSANMLRTKFYVCPVCGNIIYSIGEAVIQCHGILLSPCQEDKSNEEHMIFIEKVEDEYYIRIDHDMTKEHYISFIAALSSERIQMVKLYPEGNAEARVKINGVKKILFYCNREGLFFIDVMKGIDNKQASYDDVEERRVLEKVAKQLFG